MGRGGIGEIVWGKVSLALATVLLAVAGAIGGNRQPWIWVLIAAAVFIIVHTAARAARDNDIVRRLGRDYDRVQRRAVQIVSDLGQLAADRFDLWMIDLYLPHRRWRVSLSWPFLAVSDELLRQLSVSLIDARPQKPVLDPRTGPHGECFSQSQPLIWFDEGEHGHQPDNAWCRYDTTTNAELARVYGVLNVSPLVDQLGDNCIGVLAIHVAPERDAVVRALGALCSHEGRRRIHNACVDLNGLLGR
ncbi:MAG: hypothetical protein ACYDEY_05595 [Acidimicrobiales bacterium]